MKYKVTIDENGSFKEYVMSVEKMEDPPEEANRQNNGSIDDYVPAFPSSKLLLESAIDEYGKERERSDSLDNKAGVFIAAIVALITVYIQVLPLAQIKEAYENADKSSAVLITCSLAILVFGMSFIATSFYYFYKAMKLKSYQRVNLGNLTDEKLQVAPEDQTAEAMIRHYTSLLENNQKVNEDKADDITAGLKRCLWGFAVLSAATIIVSIVIGGVTGSA